MHVSMSTALPKASHRWHGLPCGKRLRLFHSNHRRLNEQIHCECHLQESKHGIPPLFHHGRPCLTELRTCEHRIKKMIDPSQQSNATQRLRCKHASVHELQPDKNCASSKSVISKAEQNHSPLAYHLPLRAGYEMTGKLTQKRRTIRMQHKHGMIRNHDTMHFMKPVVNSSRFRFLPMKTILHSRFSPGCQAFCGEPSKIMWME